MNKDRLFQQGLAGAAMRERRRNQLASGANGQAGPPAVAENPGAPLSREQEWANHGRAQQQQEWNALPAAERARYDQATQQQMGGAPDLGGMRGGVMQPRPGTVPELLRPGTVPPMQPRPGTVPELLRPGTVPMQPRPGTVPELLRPGTVPMRTRPGSGRNGI